MRAFLQDLADSLQMDAQHKGLSLRVHACAGSIRGDAQLLERILRNLLGNALRYTEHGGVLLSARRQGDQMRLQVWDTGEGIAGSDLPLIFDEFYQVHNAARDRTQGLGLGLSIVRRLSLLLGYSLIVQSEPGRGTLATLTVPMSDETAVYFSAQPAIPDYSQLRGRVAVVDDDGQVLDALVTLLTSWGLEVIAAESGNALCARITDVPDALLTDWRLAEGETGQQVVDKLRAKFPQATIPVLVITGDISIPTVEVARLSQLPTLHKPVKPARLRALLVKILQNR